MKHLFLTCALLFLLGSTYAQNVGIGTTTPDLSAKLEIKSDSSGMLIPRMTDAQRTAINNPATGLLVFVTTDSAFYYFDGTAWTTLDSRTRMLVDADGDSKVQIEEGADDDIIRFDMAGTEFFRMDSGRIEVLNTGNSVFIGEGAGINDDFNDHQNVAIGTRAFHSNKTGSQNVASGFHALYSNTTGNWNVASGTYALSRNTTGFGNTALGYNALDTNVTGSLNTAIGFQAKMGSSALTNASAIGAYAIVSQSNSMVLGSNANVGIGTSAPSAKLDVIGNIKITDGTQGVGKVLTSDANGLASWQAPGTNDDHDFYEMGTTTAPDSIADNIWTQGSFAFGNADGVAGGAGSEALGANSIAGGRGSLASGPNSVALGDSVYASGSDAIALGHRTRATGNYSAATGDFTTASGVKSTAMGEATTASGLSSLATGYLTTASGTDATAMGSGSTATSDASTAIGSNTTAGGAASTAIGLNTVANGVNSTAMGYGIIAQADYSFGIGLHYNVNDSITTANSMAIMGGNVGIGTVAPSSKLHVVGDVSIVNGSQGAGKVLTSDASGLASWQTPVMTAVKDADNDTGIQVEESIDEDHIRFDVKGIEAMVLDSNANVGIGTPAPDNSAKLEITSTTQGFLPPRMNVLEMNSIPNPAEGLVIYNTNYKTLNVFDGNAWVDMTGDTVYVPAIGDVYLGGVIFYIDVTSGGGLICGLDDYDGGATTQWYNGSFIATGATGTAIGTGQANSVAIIDAQGAGAYAASVTTFDDWHLPSVTELNALYTNRVIVQATLGANGADLLTGTYWSSSEISSNDALSLSFGTGGAGLVSKDVFHKARSIRSF